MESKKRDLTRKIPMKFVTVTPAGRRRYLEILASYLLRHRDVIDEHHWWLNTREPEDVAFVHQLADQHPNFFHVVVKPMDRGLSLGGGIWTYLRDCVDPDTIYARLDDDICYMADDALANLRQFREQHPEPFLVLGNIVNNAVCTHCYQQAGIVPTRWGVVQNECMDERGWRSGPFARRLHRRFLLDVEQGRASRWRQSPMEIDGTRRFSVNAICWKGEDLAAIPERQVDNIDEESFLTEDLPTRLGRPNVVCPEALFAHYAFWTQRRYLEWTAPEVLARYRRLAQQVVAGDEGHRLLFDRTLTGIRWGAGTTVWQANQGIRQLRKYLSQRKQKISRQAA